MPSFSYTCLNCQANEERISAVDDRTVVCMNCGHLMYRRNHMGHVLAAYGKRNTPAS